MDIIPVKCPACGGNLEVESGLEKAKCSFCNSDFFLSDAKNVDSSKLESLLSLAVSAYQAGNHEEAYALSSKALEIDHTNPEAWHMKAMSVGPLSTIANPRVSEMASCYQKAIEYSDEEDRPAIKKFFAGDLLDFANDYYSTISEQWAKYHEVDGSTEEFSNRVKLVLEACELAQSISSDNSENLKFIIMIYKKILGGVAWSPNFRVYVGTLGTCFDKPVDSLCEDAIAKMKTLDPSYIPPDIPSAKEFNEAQNKKNSSCFIATAAMGSYDHPLVLDLRLFRDEWLIKRSWGRGFVTCYYVCSPFAADFISKHFFLRRLTYVFLLKPLRFFVNSLFNKEEK